MKKCSRCGSTVYDEQTCPICKNDITLADYFEGDREKYVYNKYFFKYLLNETWCTILATILFFGLLKFIGQAWKASLFLIILCWIDVIFKRQIYIFRDKHISMEIFGVDFWKSRDKFFLKISKYYIPIIAILVMIFLYIVEPR